MLETLMRCEWPYWTTEVSNVHNLTVILGAWVVTGLIIAGVWARIGWLRMEERRKEGLAEHEKRKAWIDQLNRMRDD